MIEHPCILLQMCQHTRFWYLSHQLAAKYQTSQYIRTVSPESSILTYRYTKCAGIFLGLIWGQISAPSQLKIEQNLPKMVYFLPNFLVLHFGENFTKIQTKIAKLKRQENLHKNVNKNMFSFTFLCKFL